jgi:hypothetical protein
MIFINNQKIKVTIIKKKSIFKKFKIAGFVSHLFIPYPHCKVSFIHNGRRKKNLQGFKQCSPYVSFSHMLSVFLLSIHKISIPGANFIQIKPNEAAADWSTCLPSH